MVAHEMGTLFANVGFAGPSEKQIGVLVAGGCFLPIAALFATAGIISGGIWLARRRRVPEDRSKRVWGRFSVVFLSNTILVCGAGALVLASCGVFRSPTPTPTPQPNLSPVELPAPTTKLRVLSADLYEYYRRESPEFKKHEHEGKRIVVQAYGGDRLSPGGEKCFGVDAGNMQLFVQGSAKQSRRPAMVYVMNNSLGWGTGERWGDVFIEGTLRGPVAFTSKTWAKDWVRLTPQMSMKDHFVLIEDCRLVSVPK